MTREDFWRNVSKAGNDSYLFDAGWLFFAGWSLVLVALSLIAFGEDLPSPVRNRNREEQY
jgi:hypothetical protein